MSKTLRVAVACFIGGAVGTAIMVLILPQIWYLGVLTGLAGGFLVGYTSFEFKKVLAAIPKAMLQAMRACRATGNGFVWLMDEIFIKLVPATIGFTSKAWRKFRKWAQEPRPFFVIPCILGCSAWIGIAYFTGLGTTHFSEVFFLGPLAATEISVAFGIFTVFLPLLGARVGEKVYWEPEVVPEGYSGKMENFHEKKQYAGLTLMPLTYGNFFRWFFKGLFLLLYIPLRLFFKIILINGGKLLIAGVILLAKFSWTLFKLIHSQERLICGVDSALGVLAAYFLFVNGAHSIGEICAIILSGGLLGAVLGVVNFELVSKRLLAKYVTIKS